MCFSPHPSPFSPLAVVLGAQTEIEGVLEEAAVLKRLSHSSIVSLMKFESLPSCNYLVLEVGFVRVSSVPECHGMR